MNRPKSPGRPTNVDRKRILASLHSDDAPCDALTSSELAARLKVSVTSIRRFQREGLIHSQKIDGRHYFSPIEVQKVLALFTRREIRDSTDTLVAQAFSKGVPPEKLVEDGIISTFREASRLCIEWGTFRGCKSLEESLALIKKIGKEQRELERFEQEREKEVEREIEEDLRTSGSPPPL